MTTDLTGDFELDEEEFDWDVFLPDPDEAEIAAQAAALEDEAELDLDDSDLDWEATLQEEPPSEREGRAGAAFERIVDTVRRSFEEPDSDVADDPGSLMGQEPHTAVVPELEDEAELELEAEFEPELELELEFEPELELGAEFGPELELEHETELASEPHAEIDAQADRKRDADSSPATEPVSRSALETEPGWETEVLLVAEPTPEPGAEMEWGSRPEDHTARSAEPEVAQVVGAVAVAAPIAPADPEPALVSTSPALLEPEDGTASEAGPAHARTRKNHEANERSRVFTATVVLACLVLVIVAAALAVRSLHHATPATTSPPARSASRVSSTADAARIETATGDVDAATTAVRAGLASMTSFPTPANVATIINPYISSLQLYEAVLSGSKVPPSATSEGATAEAEARQDLTFLDTIHGLPPVQLGAYLGQVGTDTTQLQSTLSGLEQSLRP